MVTTLNRKAKRMGRFFYGGGAIANITEIPNRAHADLTGLANDDHTIYQLALLAKAVPAQNVSNSVAETDMFDEAIAASILAANGDALEFFLVCRVLNNTAGAQTLTLRVYVPTGTLLWNTGALSLPQGVNERALYLWGTVQRRGPTQGNLAADCWVGPLGTFVGAGAVTPGTAAFYVAGTRQNLTADWTLAQSIRTTFQMGVASASFSAGVDSYLIRRAR